MITTPLLLFAQTESILHIGAQTITYDKEAKVGEVTLYYQADTLVASQQADVWIMYKDDQAVLEAYDTNTDGTPDTFVTLSKEGEVQAVTGEGATELERPVVVPFDDLLSKETGTTGTEEDLVGDISSITIPSYHNYTLYTLVLLVLGGGYWWYKKRKYV